MAVLKPDPLNGYDTNSITFDPGLGKLKIHFRRPFEVQNSYGLDLNSSYPDYKLYLNWGVFENELDNST